jgi:glutaredoxin
MKKVEIYSTPTCHFCHLAKELLASLNVPFSDYNVQADAARRQELIDTGAQGVPMIKITHENGEVETMMGYDEERLRELFAAAA